MRGERSQRLLGESRAERMQKTEHGQLTGPGHERTRKPGPSRAKRWGGGGEQERKTEFRQERGSIIKIGL